MPIAASGRSLALPVMLIQPLANRVTDLAQGGVFPIAVHSAASVSLTDPIVMLPSVQ